MNKKRILITSFVLVATILTGCTGFDSRPNAKTVALPKVAEQPYDPALKSFYEQKIKWEKCSDDRNSQCADIKAPLNYNEPDGEQITLSARKIQASGNKIGTLFINPGGPGGSGKEFAIPFQGRMASAALSGGYDIVGFDPRGVGDSTPVKCLSDKEIDTFREDDSSVDSAETAPKDLDKMADFSQSCVNNSGEIVKYMDTVSTAKDLDIWRHLVKDPQLNYLGFSYGTSLGEAYIALFPHSVGRMVLDGVVDNRASADQLSYYQAVGFENAFKAFSDYYKEYAYPEDTKVTAEQVAQDIMDFIESLGDKGMSGKGDMKKRRLNTSIAFSGLATGLYNEEQWPDLESALNAAIVEKNPNALIALSDMSAGRNEDGKYDNSFEAFYAINNLDYATDEVDPQTEIENNKIILQDAPLTGKFFLNSQLYTNAWKMKSVNQGKLVPETQPDNKIMIVGTTGDPATSYEMAQAVHKQISNSYLLTWENFTHCAYGNGSACIQKAVDNYLLRGEFPKQDNLQCK